MEQETIVEWRESLVDDLLQKLVSPETLTNEFIVVGACLVLGLLSAHYLRQFKDFDRKDKMMWGANWLWLVLLAIAAVYKLVAYLALTHIPYTVTVVLGFALASPLLLWFLFRRLKYRAGGVATVIAVWGNRVRGREVHLEKFMGEPNPRWTRIVSVISHVVHGVALVFFVVVMLCLTYPLDRAIIQQAEAERLEPVFRQKLESPQLSDLYASSPPPHVAYPYTREGLGVMLRSAKNIIGVGPENPPPQDIRDYWLLAVKTTQDADKKQALKLADEAEKLVASHSGGHYWHIEICVVSDTSVIRRYYPRKMHTGH